MFDAVWGRNLILMCCRSLSKYTTMSMTAVRLCSLNANVWNGIALAWRTVGAFVLVCAWIWSCYLVFDAVLWCRNLALMLCCQNKLQYGNDGCAFIMFVKYMARRHVTHGWLAGTFVFGCPWIRAKLLLLVFDVIWDCNLTLMCCPNTSQCR